MTAADIGKVWTFTVALLLGLWFVGSVIHQFAPSWWMGLARSDVFGLLPRWNFFAPMPGRSDSHVIYRDQQDGLWLPWQTLTQECSGRHWGWIWNPDRYPRKAVADLVNDLRRSIMQCQETPRAILLSNAYLGLLRWIAAQPAAPGNTHRQFAIVTTTGFGERKALDVLFVSEPHPIDG